MVQLDTLKRVPLRNAWAHEASDFTTWLAQVENLSLLSEEVGLDIKLLQTEANVGKFNVDILAEEENTGRKIIIENQLEITDHDHLGKIITYASGFDAEVIIWIVADVREEHERAIDWLNEHSDEEINFFVIKMELWQIGTSPFAPKFQIISKPNDWAKAVKQSATKASLTDAKILQLEFWNKFKEFASSRDTRLRLRKTSPQHWYDVSIGSSEAHVSLTINTRDNQVACEMYISDSKDLYFYLESKKEKIESELGYNLEWMELEGKKASRIKVSQEGDVNNEESWENLQTWLLTKAEEFSKIFPKYIRKATRQ